jgi:hypothetical protein
MGASDSSNGVEVPGLVSSVSSANFTEQYCAPQEAILNRVASASRPCSTGETLWRAVRWRGHEWGELAANGRLGPDHSLDPWGHPVRNRSAAKPARASNFHGADV